MTSHDDADDDDDKGDAADDVAADDDDADNDDDDDQDDDDDEDDEDNDDDHDHLQDHDDDDEDEDAECDDDDEQEDDDEEDDAVEEENRSQDRKAYLARACAVEMHMNIVQEPFCVEMYRKNAGRQSQDMVFCELAQSKCTWTFQKSNFVWNCQEKRRTSIPRHTFCASLRSRNAHGHFRRAILC